MVAVKCGTCSQLLHASAGSEGKFLRCGRCGKVTQVRGGWGGGRQAAKPRGPFLLPGIGAAVAALFAAIGSLLPWYSIRGTKLGFSVGANGLDFTEGVLSFVLAILLLAGAAAAFFLDRQSRMLVSFLCAILALGVFLPPLVLLLRAPNPANVLATAYRSAGISYGFSFGIYLTMAAGLATGALNLARALAEPRDV